MSAQQETITVVDLELQEPLVAVIIHNQDFTFSTQTDLLGKASIESMSDSDTLIFRLVAYETKKMSLGDIKASASRVMLQPVNPTLGEVVVMGANKQPESSRSVPSIVDVLDQEAIARINPQTSADLLKATGNVFVQKSQMGGGSPIIRGFEANKVLIVVDGVRMNNAIYRSGHLQNVISIDHAGLDRVEVIYGPSSTIYGSDALGGVMHFYTLPVKYEHELGKEQEIGVFARYSSANQEKTVHLDHRFAGKKWGAVASITFSDFGDLRAGNNRKAQ
ncbi:MAG: TonB-dependent receptor plug domain-containing protein, partial [Bacteroidota bacterium]